jgi:hypothetical protein
MSTQLSLRRTAAAWRKKHRDHSEGVVLIHAGRAYGWKNALRDPGHEMPGVYAVDSVGAVFVATGGDTYNGAKQWEPASEGGAK